ncbi:MAG: STAS/SEC14 domain-containing protein [Caulobacteraceae bacterium]|nr:STAS/SEC14 domain-containing protein [Caulobacteraceae bacterium]
MITYVSEPGSPVVEIKLQGHLTNADLEAAIERLNVDIEQHGKVRVLEIIEHFTGMEPAALWTDVKLGVPLARKIARAAVVADQGWIRAFTGLGKLFTSADIKSFAPADLEEARRWIAAE